MPEVSSLSTSGMDAIGIAARAIKTGEADLMIGGGVESMSRAPFVLGKAEAAFSRKAEIHDTTIGWRFVNPLMRERYGTDSMPETGDNVAEQYGIDREDQDAFALCTMCIGVGRGSPSLSSGKSKRAHLFQPRFCALPGKPRPGEVGQALFGAWRWNHGVLLWKWLAPAWALDRRVRHLE